MTKKTLIFFLLLCNCWLIQAMDVDFPLVQSIVYNPYPNHPTLGKKEFRVFLNMNYANEYMYDSKRIIINDMEMWSNTLGLGYGLTDKITLELYYRVVVAHGGFLDKFIMDFHKFFGMGQGGRSDYPPNVMNYRYKNYFAYDESVTFQSPLILGALARLYQTGNFCINGRLAVGLPLSSKPGFSGNRPFLTGGVIFLYKTKNLSIHFANHLSVFKDPKWLPGEDIKNRILHSEIRVDYKKIFGGIQFKSTPFKSNDLQNDAYQAYLGFKFLKYFEFSLLEEFPPMDTTPDVAFNLKINIMGPRR